MIPAQGSRSQSLLHQVCGWNGDGMKEYHGGKVSIPSSSGLRLEYATCGMPCTEGESQSLLHQVCGWNRNHGGRSHAKRVSIPSSSGLRLELDLDATYAPGTEVSIPSSSGLRLESAARATRGSWSGLNPFFIRSAVGMEHDAKEAVREIGLNPFFIRSAVGIWPPASTRARRRRLNPFFIRSAVGMLILLHEKTMELSQSLLHQVCGWNTMLLFSASKQCLGTGVVPSRLVCPS